MDALVATFEGWIRAGAGWAPVAIFVITFLESLPGISILVPATALLLAIGALLGAGTLEPVPVLIAAIAGAIAGDAVGFWVSRAVGLRVVRRWLPRSQRRAYARALLLFRRWGWAAVFFGRFLGPVRAVAPLIAGVARMRERHFQSANIASAIVWAPAMLLPGYAAARGAEEMAATDHPLLIGGALLLISAAGWFGLRQLRRRTAR
ncbi:DedA family protein [Falsiroseomonas sp. E2-1-a20]|uniref:DedA family protein n=1 Tax=Falsiroseomonas sp. E2-1-a20 TaxID=3239300 RepID=UPI003F3E1796